MKKLALPLNRMAAACLLACAASNLAAQVAPANGVPVHMLVTVEARHGSDVPVVNREDVMVFEGKERDTVTDWVPAQGDHADMELFLLIDDGSSASLGTQLEDLRKFINGQPVSTKVGVAYMQNGNARILQNLTSDHELAAKSLRLPMGAGDINASPYFSLSDLVKHWPPNGARHEVLMITDGIDRYYGRGDTQDPYVEAAIDDAQRAGVLVHAIYSPGAGHFGHAYWWTYWGQLFLSEVTAETGGESYYIGFNGAPVSFVPYLNEMEDRFGHQYLLTFLAKPQKKAGFQRVKLTTEVTNAELVSANQVYVPAVPQ